MPINSGIPAPDFKLLDDTNSPRSLADYRGKNIVLYFYPKDDTPGCTLEAQEFTKHIKEFTKLNCIVLGISKDSIASHCKFSDKYNLEIKLLSDESQEVCNKYGVIVEKNMYGKKSMGIERTTFLINESGIISNIWNKVKVDGHVDEVLKTLRGSK